MAEHPNVARIRAAAEGALNAAEAVLPEWLPEGQRKGSEWIARNVVRGDRSAGSFGVSLTTGKWNDFAAEDAHGGDLVSLLAYLRGCRQVEAAREIDAWLGLGIFSNEPSRSAPAPAAATEARRSKEEWRRLEEASRTASQERAAKRARKAWKAAGAADTGHPYLAAKAVPAHGVRQSGKTLLVPLYHEDRLVNLQRIHADGSKRFLRDGRVTGAYAPIGRIQPRGRLYVCEGWATGATIHEDTGSPVACAMNAGNLRHVAIALASKYGDTVELIIAGDDDRQTDGNPGRTAARRAALEAGALMIFPAWPDGAPEYLSDFNDLHTWHCRAVGVAQ